MKRTVVVNGEEREVEVGDGYAVVDGERYEVDAAPRADGYDVHVDGAYFDVQLTSETFGVYRGAVDGTDARLLYAAQAKKRGGAAAGKAHVVEAPMPGTVLDVDVGPGEEVQIGDRLLTLEAMKMENEILAQHGGVVEEVHVGPGDAVDGGEPLVVIGSGEEE